MLSGAKLLKINANNDHPIRSFMVAAPVMIIPISVFIKSRSIRILTMTGRADIDSAVPINIAKSSVSTWKCPFHRLGNKKTVPKPSMNGTTMPIKLAETMLVTLFLARLRFISRPAANKKKSTQI